MKKAIATALKALILAAIFYTVGFVGGITYTVFFPIIALVAAIAWSATEIKNPIKTAVLIGFMAAGWKAVLVNLGFIKMGGVLDALLIISVLGFYALAFYRELRLGTEKKIKK